MMLYGLGLWSLVFEFEFDHDVLYVSPGRDD